MRALPGRSLGAFAGFVLPLRFGGEHAAGAFRDAFGAVTPAALRAGRALATGVIAFAGAGAEGKSGNGENGNAEKEGRGAGPERFPAMQPMQPMGD